MKNEWVFKNFYNSFVPVERELAKFLNENNIEEFKIIRASDTYISIIYKTNL